MSEYLSFNQHGQWSLHKNTGGPALSPPKTDYTPGSKKRHTHTSTALEGKLREDFGTKGSLRDFGAGHISNTTRTDFKNVGKPIHYVESSYNEQHPGVGD
jgi:hypothetical protein